jgi:hypothetical protein
MIASEKTSTLELVSALNARQTLTLQMSLTARGSLLTLRVIDSGAA